MQLSPHAFPLRHTLQHCDFPSAATAHTVAGVDEATDGPGATTAPMRSERRMSLCMMNGVDVDEISASREHRAPT
jgi:hypothetical protein